MLYLQSFLRKGVSLGYVGRNYNLKDLKDGIEYGAPKPGFLVRALSYLNSRSAQLFPVQDEGNLRPECTKWLQCCLELRSIWGPDKLGRSNAALVFSYLTQSRPKVEGFRNLGGSTRRAKP